MFNLIEPFDLIISLEAPASIMLPVTLTSPAKVDVPVEILVVAAVPPELSDLYK